MLLLTLGLGALWLYSGMFMKDVELAGRTIGFRERSIGLGALTVVMLYFFAGVGSALFTLIGLSVVVVVAHATFHKSATEQENLLDFSTDVV